MKFLSENIDKDNIMLVNVLYQRGKVDDKYEDFLSIIYKKIDTGEKKIKVIKRPKMEIYFTKNEYRDYDYNKAFIELYKTDKHTVDYKMLAPYIAAQAGPQYLNFIKQCMETRNYQAISDIHKYPYVFGSDLNVETWYRIQWLLEYDNESEKLLTKQFMDIEVDSIDVEGFPRDGECPINAVTIVDEENKECYTFLLDTKNNPQIPEFVDDIDSFIDELHDAFDESYGVLDYKIFMYEDEKELIVDMFKLINTLKRDFMLIWNGGGFDLPYIIERIKNLNMVPEDVMCHPDFPVKTCVFRKDTRNFDVAHKGDSLKLSSYTKFLDQMVLYAATRKGQSELRSNALNYIGQAELGDEKLDYSDEANIKTLPYKNYRKFVMYNIKDVLLQYGIERKVNDIENLYLRAYSNATDYDKVFRQTVTLKSRAYIEYFLQGNIIGNNINENYGDKSSDEKEVTFSGAIVGDPLLNSNTGLVLFGKRSMYVYNNVIDMDFSSMYPHIIIAFNIERNTMIGKLIIEGFNNDRYEHYFIKDKSSKSDDDDDDDTTYDAGKDFMDNYLTGDILSMGTKWFNLPDFKTLDTEFRNTFNIKPKKRIMFSNKIKNILKERLFININTGDE